MSILLGTGVLEAPVHFVQPSIHSTCLSAARATFCHSRWHFLLLFLPKHERIRIRINSINTILILNSSLKILIGRLHNIANSECLVVRYGVLADSEKSYRTRLRLVRYDFSSSAKTPYRTTKHSLFAILCKRPIKIKWRIKYKNW